MSHYSLQRLRSVAPEVMNASEFDLFRDKDTRGPATFARIIVTGVAREVCNGSFPEIAMVCGDASHSTAHNRHRLWQRLPAWIREAAKSKFRSAMDSARVREEQAA